MSTKNYQNKWNINSPKNMITVLGAMIKNVLLVRKHYTSNTISKALKKKSLINIDIDSINISTENGRVIKYLLEFAKTEPFHLQYRGTELCKCKYIVVKIKYSKFHLYSIIQKGINI